MNKVNWKEQLHSTREDDANEESSHLCWSGTLQTHYPRGMFDSNPSFWNVLAKTKDIVKEQPTTTLFLVRRRSLVVAECQFFGRVAATIARVRNAFNCEPSAIETISDDGRLAFFECVSFFLW